MQIDEEKAKSGPKPKRRAPLPVGWRAGDAARKAEAAASKLAVQAAKRDAQLCAEKAAALGLLAEARAKLAGLPPDEQGRLLQRLDATEQRLKDIPVCPGPAVIRRQEE